MRWAANLVDAFQPAEGPPPRTLFAFFMWCLKGSMPWLWVAGFLSAIAGTLEVLSALVAGARSVLAPGAALALEVAESQAGTVSQECRDHGLEEVRVVADLAGRPRVVSARAPGGSV